MAFWQWPNGPDGAEEAWVRIVSLDFPADRGLAAHSAPADALFLCVGGTIRFSLEGETRDLRPGDGVAMRAGQVHAVAGGAEGRALLLLRRPAEGA